MTPLRLALSALQEIAESAIRCEPCGAAGDPVDAVASVWRLEGEAYVSVLVCDRCLSLEVSRGLDSCAPFRQPPHVLTARRTLAEVSRLQGLQQTAHVLSTEELEVPDAKRDT